MTRFFRATFFAACFCGWAAAGEMPHYQLEIQSQPLSAALQAFARQSGVQVMFFTDTPKGVTTRPLVGSFTTEQALQSLLEGTGLTYSFINDHTVTISAPESSKAQEEQPTSDSSVARLEEVLVTAQKREERLQDVPVPVTAINAQTLVANNQLRLQDYYTSIPGLSVATGDFHAAPMLAIRGITTGGGFTNPTVGIVVDDVPYGSSTINGGGYLMPDLDPSDLARVEVLRGPQGTLYGASSIGGLLKFVTVDPSTERFNGSVQAGLSSVVNGDELGYSLRGSANIPVNEVFALRASAFTRRDAGYVDNVLSAKDGVNRGESSGGRLSALLRPSDAWSLELSALYQGADVYGSPYVVKAPGLGTLEQNQIPGTGAYRTRYQAYNATLSANLGEMTLTAISGYNVNSNDDSYDLTPAIGGFTEFVTGVAGSPTFNHYETDKFTQEVRLAGSFTPSIEWLAGAFYTHEKSHYVQDVFAADETTGVIVAPFNHADIPSTFAEQAVFANLTYHFTDRFDTQFGGRYSENRQKFSEVQAGAFVGGTAITPETHSKESAFTYLVTPRFKVSEQLMLYARLASGYRAGGINQNQNLGLPPSFAPDKTRNYEIGAKGNLIPGVLSWDASVYSIEWKDIQINLVNTQGAGFIANASEARSQGVELAFEARPRAGMTISVWGAYSDAELTEDFPAGSSANGSRGDRLPYSSRLSGNVSLDQEFPLGAQWTGVVGASVSYVGDRRGQFWLGTPRQEFPQYTRADLRLGVRSAVLSVNAFVNNLADERALLVGGRGTFSPNAFNYIQPRTIGLTVTRDF